MMMKTGREAQRVDVGGRGRQRDDVKDKLDRELDSGKAECAKAGPAAVRARV